MLLVPLLSHISFQTSFGLKLVASSDLAVLTAGLRDFSLYNVGNSKSLFIGICSLAKIFLYNVNKLFWRLMAGGAMLLNAGSHSKGVDWTVPVIILIDLLSSTSTFFACALLSQDELQYSAHEYSSARAVVRRTYAVAPTTCLPVF